MVAAVVCTVSHGIMSYGNDTTCSPRSWLNRGLDTVYGGTYELGWPIIAFKPVGNFLKSFGNAITPNFAGALPSLQRLCRRDNIRNVD